MNAPAEFRQVLHKLVWSHKKFAEALSLARAHAIFSPPGSMVLIVGASGTGKTTMLRQLKKELAGAEDSWEPGKIPVIDTSIYNDVQALFNSKNLTLRLLQATRQAFYGASQQVALQAPNGLDEGLIALGKLRLNYSEPHLRLVLENALLERGTLYILIDEAQHLMKAGSIQKAIDNLDCIKGLAERTGAIILLFGTFEILPIWNRSAQLNRRLQDVILHRYRREIADDLVEFEMLLESFSQLLPLQRGLSLRDLNEFIYDATQGIIGEVSRLVIGAYSRMSATSATCITSDMLRAAAHSPAKLVTLQRETEGGEAMLEGSSAAEIIPPFVRKKPQKTGRRGHRAAIRDPTGRTRTVVLKNGDDLP